VLGFLGGFALVNVGIYDKHAPSTAPAFIVGISLAAMAWPLSSLPIYVRRRRVTAAVRA
jgi:hypothetical protein